MAIHASGAEGRRLYLDAVDEAMAGAARAGKKPTGPRRPRRQVNDVAIRQLKDVERQRRILSRALTDSPKALCKGCGEPTEVVPIASVPRIVEDSAQVTDQIVKLSQSIRLGHEAERKAFAGLTEDDLDQVFRSQLARMASKLDDADKRVLLTIWFGEDVTEVLLRPRDTQETAPNHGRALPPASEGA